ncbi:MAG: hypothetical protein WD278_07880, partial [Pirellulales bacterium]
WARLGRWALDQTLDATVIKVPFVPGTVVGSSARNEGGLAGDFNPLARRSYRQPLTSRVTSIGRKEVVAEISVHSTAPATVPSKGS